MIKVTADLGLNDLDPKVENFWELVDAALTEKLGITLLQTKQPVADYVLAHAEELTLQLPNIAPYDNYAKLIENNDDMATFLKSDVAKPEAWELKGISDHDQHKSLLRFEFICKAVDAGETLDAKVFISKSGIIRHCFVYVND